MKTADLFRRKRVLSFEVFPPKRTSPIDTIYSALDQLRELSPDFISVTYGAGGSENSKNTFDIASHIQNDCGITAAAHLPCINLTKAEVLILIKSLSAAGIENVLALRGDIVPGIEPKNDFKYASDLVSFIREHSDLNILGACYPEGHPEAESVEADIQNLKIKADAGVNHLVTQLFFDNEHFYDFRDRTSAAGIDVPIEAGIMPVVNKAQIERMVSLCRVDLPKKFTTMMARFEHDPHAMRDAGIAYAVNQIVDLVANGVDGIHLYTMNNPYIADKICEATCSVISS